MENKNNNDGLEELYKAIFGLWVATFLLVALVAVTSCSPAKNEPYPSMYRYER